MSDFELFSQALNEYEKTAKEPEPLAQSSVPGSESSDPFSECQSVSDQVSDWDDKESDDCLHPNIANETGADVCIDCGEEITKKIQHTKEWRYYGQSDTRHSSDPNRVQIRKSEERSIYKDVENMGFSDKIVSEANKIYFQVTHGQIFRGNSRKSIVFACIFHAYKLSGKPQSHEKLIHVFNLNRKTGLKGLKHVNLHAPKNSSIRTTYITPINLVEEIMDKFSATPEQKQEVVKLYHQIKNKSSRLNRSRPQSVASGIVYHWICSKKKDITLKQFTKKVALSELTVNKIAKEIADVIGADETISEPSH
jgi:transcription initiation factor TFIIIB Brf1 subunit/transcription initiation factor TFIIB